MSSKKSVTLTNPPPIAAIAGITELTFREMRASDFRGVNIRRLYAGEWMGEDLINLIANNAGAPVEIVEALKSDDFNFCVGTVLDFFLEPGGQAPATGSPSSTGEA